MRFKYPAKSYEYSSGADVFTLIENDLPVHSTFGKNTIKKYIWVFYKRSKTSWASVA
jgi:hypothetical protein